jgi:hypothetical protein
MMVRKMKNYPNKGSEFSESNKSIKLVKPDDVKFGFSSTQGPILFKKTRSSSALKKTLNKNLSSNITPLNRKLRNFSYNMGNTPDISESCTLNGLIDDQKQKFLINLEGLLIEQKKKSNKKEVFFDVLIKITEYDPCLKRIIEEIVDGLKEIENNSFIDPELMKKTLNELTHERNKLKKDLERCKEVFKYMKNKREVPVEKIFQEYNDLEKSKKMKDHEKQLNEYEKRVSPLEPQINNLEANEKYKNCIESKLKNSSKHLKLSKSQVKFYETHSKPFENPNSCKNQTKEAITQLKSNTKTKSIPKLELMPSGDFGFQQEFMSKINEFSESWRALIRKEKSSINPNPYIKLS